MCFVAAGHVTLNVNDDLGAGMTLLALGLLIWSVIRSWKENAPERKARMEKLREKNAARQKQIAAEAEARRIVEVKLLEGGTIRHKRMGLKGALLGGLFGGPIGVLAGALTPGSLEQQKQRFAVRYADGTIRILECYPGTRRHEELMKYVKWEEI